MCYQMFWLPYFLSDNSYRSIIILFLLLANEYFLLFFFSCPLLPAFDLFVFVSLENEQAF